MATARVFSQCRTCHARNILFIISNRCLDSGSHMARSWEGTNSRTTKVESSASRERCSGLYPLPNGAGRRAHCDQHQIAIQQRHIFQQDCIKTSTNIQVLCTEFKQQPHVLLPQRRQCIGLSAPEPQRRIHQVHPPETEHDYKGCA